MILLLLLLLLPLNVTGATSSNAAKRAAANEDCLVFTLHPASEPDKATTSSRNNTLQLQRTECQGGGRLFLKVYFTIETCSKDDSMVGTRTFLWY
jgi:hypothetical protein